MRTDYSRFVELGGTNWINTAHQGAIPREAARAAKRAVERARMPDRASK
jgi:hypothetical protein